MLRAFTALIMLAAIMLSILTLPPLFSVAYTGNNQSLRGSLTVLAVMGKGANTRGIPLKLSMEITRGEGKIYLSLTSLAGEDFQASVKLSILIGTIVAGKDYTNYNYYVELEPHVNSISGPSAGAAIATLTIALLNGLNINESIAITGVMLPDITIGPVGGLPKKIEAASKAGVKIVIIPSGQLIVRNPITNATINITSIAREYGLNVMEASNLYEILKILGGRYGYLKNTSVITLKLSSIPVFKNTVSKWINEFNRTYMKLSNKVSIELNLCRDKALSNIAIKITKEAEERFNEALRELYEDELYASISDMFSAVISLTTAYWLLKGCIDGWDTLNVLISNVSSEVHKALNTFETITRELNSAYSISINKLSLGVEVLKRVYEMNETFNSVMLRYKSIKYSNMSSVLNLIDDLSYTYWRADSVLKWCELFNIVEDATDPHVKLSTLRRVVELLTYYSKVTLDYMGTLIKVRDTYINDLYELVNKASEIAETNPIYSLSLSMDAIAKISALLSASYSVNMTKKALTLRAISLNLASSALSQGFKPLVTLTYIERGDSLLKQDPYLSIYFYDLALTNTMWYLMLIQAHRVKPAITMIAQPYQYIPISVLIMVLITCITLVIGFILGYGYCRRSRMKA